jgi:hypothetical protein
MGLQNFKDLSDQLGQQRNDLLKSYVPKFNNYGERALDFQSKVIDPFRQGMEADRTSATGDIGTLRSFMTGVMSDPSKRGYDEGTLQGMRSRAMDTIAGARRAQMAQLSKQVAAAGMGNTGIGIRATQDYGRDAARQMREAMRDIDISQGEASREDLWKGAQGLQNVQGMDLANRGQQLQSMGLSQNAMDQYLKSIMGEGQFYSDFMLPSYGQQGSLLAEKAKPGFWMRQADKAMSMLMGQ